MGGKNGTDSAAKEDDSDPERGDWRPAMLSTEQSIALHTWNVPLVSMFADMGYDTAVRCRAIPPYVSAGRRPL